jgi:hypothetical protein
MAENQNTYAKKFSGMFSSLTTFLCCAVIFYKTRGHMDMGTLIHGAFTVVPAALIVGYLGNLIGKICDSTKKKKKLNKYVK